MLFNIPIPDIFQIGQNILQGYQVRHERPLGYDPRNSVLVQPLEDKLFKLEDIRARMESRIEKEVASGTPMTKSIQLLNIADQTLIFSAQAVAIATSTITGSNPRPGYRENQQAYFALGQSWDALNAVLQAIEAETASSSTSSARLN